MKRLLVTFAVMLAAAGCGGKDTNVGTNNPGCTPQCSDRECGDDGCGGSCGTCGANATCDPATGTCRCGGETDAELCAKAGYACGALTTTDRCGVTRVIESCGGCAVNEACAADTHTCQCAGETDAELCARVHRVCGTLEDIRDRCGVERTVQSCGGCRPNWDCNVLGACDCVSEPEVILCLNAGAECGSPTLHDRCGGVWTNANCGVCEDPKYCGEDFTCTYPAVPANDTCETAKALTLVDGFVRVNGTTHGANDDVAPQCLGMTGAVDVVYRFELPQTSSVYLTATPVGGTDVLAVSLFDQCGAADAVVRCGQMSGATAIAAKRSLPAGTYYVVVDATSASVDFALEIRADAPPPANDQCAGATALVWDDIHNVARATGDTFIGTDDEVSSCSIRPPPLSGRDLVYKFTLTSAWSITATVTRDASDDSYLPAVSIRSSCAASDELVCGRVPPRDPFTGRQEPTAKATVTLDPGTYYVIVDGENDGPFELKVTRDAPVPGDGCGNPEPLFLDTATGIATATGDLSQMTASGDGTCRWYSGNDKVYSLTLGAEKMVAMTLARPSSTAPLRPVVYLRRECAQVTSELACAAEPLGVGNAVTAPVRLHAGTYYVWVDAASPSFNGAYELTVTATDPANPAPSNDTCAGVGDAITLGTASRSAQVLGDTRDAFDDYNDACSTSEALLNGPDLVYKVELQQAGRLFVAVTRDASTPGYLPAVYLRTACATANGAESATCNAAADVTQAIATVSKQLAAGTYFVVVDGTQGTAGKFKMQLEFDAATAVPSTCIDAQVLQFDDDGVAEVIGDTTRSTTLGGASCGSGGGNGSGNNPALAYVFNTRAARDLSIVVLPSGNLHPTVYVRSVCDDGATEEGCMYTPRFSAVSLNLPHLPAGDHTIWVGGDQGAGAFFMTVRLTPSANIANDVCNGAQSLTLPSPGNTVRVNASTSMASDDLEGGCATGYYRMTGPDLVYKVTVGTPVQITATVTPSAGTPTYQPAVYLRSTCDQVSNDVCTFSQNPGAAATLTASLGTGDWYLVVDGVFGTLGDFELAVTQSATGTVDGDGCANAIPLQFTTDLDDNRVATFSGDSSAALNDYEPSGCYSSGGQDLVYAFEVTQLSLVTVTVGPSSPLSNFTSGLYLRTTCADPTTELRCVNTSQPQTPVTANVANLTPGTYYLFIDTFGADLDWNGPFTGTVTIAAQPNPPTNNECVGATQVTLPASGASALRVSGSTITATNSYAGGCQSPSSSQPMDGPDVSYYFTVSGDTQVFAKVIPAASSPNFMPAVYIRRDCSRSDADICRLQSAAGVPVWVAASLKAGTYYVIVDGLSGSSGEFDLELSQNSTLYVNADNCMNAGALNFTGGPNGSQVATFSEDNSLARTPPAVNDGDSCWSGAPDFVYTFTLGQESEVDVDLAPSGASGYTPSFYLRSSCFSPVGEIYCATTYLAQPVNKQLFRVPAGTWYLWIDGADQSIGTTFWGAFTGTVTVKPMATAPLNDSCTGAELLDVSSGSASVTGQTSLANDDESGGCGTGPAPDVAYMFTIGSAQKIVATVTRDSTTPTYFPVVYIRNACNVSSPTAELACGQVSWSGAATATINDAPAGTYYVWVDGMPVAVSPDRPTPGKFQLDVTVSAPVAGTPANDYCSGAIPLVFTHNVAQVTGDTAMAVADTTNRCTYSAWPDVVYSFTLGAARRVTVTEQAGSGQLPAFEIRRACGSMNSNDAVLCANPQVPGGVAKATIPSLEAGTYYVWVTTENSNATSTQFTLTVALDAPDLRIPPNDTCSGAIALARGIPVSGDSGFAVNDYLGPPYSEVCRQMANTYINWTGPDLVYKYTPRLPGPFTVKVQPAPGYLAQIWVTEGQCGVGTACVAMPFQFGGALRTTVQGTGGQTYYIGVDSISLDAAAPIKAGKFTITIQ